MKPDENLIQQIVNQRRNKMNVIKTYTEKYPKVKKLIAELKEHDIKIDIGYSWLQRSFKIGFMEACQLHDKLLANGIIKKVDNHFEIV